MKCVVARWLWQPFARFAISKNGLFIIYQPLVGVYCISCGIRWNSGSVKYSVISEFIKPTLRCFFVVLFLGRGMQIFALQLSSYRNSQRLVFHAPRKAYSLPRRIARDMGKALHHDLFYRPLRTRY